MNEWLTELFESLKHARVVLMHPWPAWVVAPLLAGCVYLVIRLYSKERRMVPLPTGYFLLGLRILLVLLVLLMLLEPVVSLEYKRPVRGVVVVAIDKSLSMNVPGKVSSNASKLMAAEALGLLPSGLRNRNPEQLSQDCAAALKALNTEVSPSIENYRSKLVRHDPQAEQAYDEAVKSCTKFVAKLKDIVRLAATVVREQGPNSAEQSQLLAQKANALGDLINRELEGVASRLKAAPAAVAVAPGQRAAQPPATAGIDAVRNSLNAVRPHLAEISPLAMQLQRLADERLATSADPKVRKPMEDIENMTRLDHCFMLLGGTLTKLAERLQENNDVRFFAFDTETKPVSVPVVPTAKELEIAVGKATGEKTEIGETLLRAVDMVKDQSVVGVVFLTDGRHNLPTSPMDLVPPLTQRKIPLFPIGVGDTEPPKDISVTHVVSSETVYKGDKVQVQAVITPVGFPGDLPVRVMYEGQTLAEKIVNVQPGDRSITVKLPFLPPPVEQGVKMKEFVFKIGVPEQPGEYLPDNNWRDFRVTVIADKLKVLFVDRDPRWEYIFLKRDLERDKYVEMHSILLSKFRTGDELVMPHGDEPGQFPNTKEQIYKYKMIIIGDVPPSALTPEDQENLWSYVSDNGGVLVIISGKRSMPSQYRESRLADLLPIIPFENPKNWKPPGSFKQPFRLQLTPYGKEEPFLTLNPDPQANAKAWSHLPPIYWFAPVEKAKETAFVLIVVPQPPEWQGNIPPQPEDQPKLYESFRRAQEINRPGVPGVPLMALETVGLGRVLWLGTDSTWRWRYKVADEYFHRLWGQILRWSTTGHFTGRDRYTMMGTRKAEYEENEPVVLEARLLYPNPRSTQAELIPYNNGNVTAVVYEGTDTRSPNPKEITRLKMHYVSGTGGFYRAEFQGFKGGDYFIRLVVPELPLMRPEDQAAALFRVAKNPAAEYYDVTLNENLLKELAARTGGKYFNLSTARDLPAEIERNPRMERVHTEVEAWNSWPFFALFCFLLILEWAWRKWKGLI